MDLQWDGIFSDDLTVGTENNNAGDGKKIRFGYNGKTDPLWIGRYNVNLDETEFRVNLSDDGQATDKLVVGYQPWSGRWVTFRLLEPMVIVFSGTASGSIQEAMTILQRMATCVQISVQLILI